MAKRSDIIKISKMISKGFFNKQVNKKLKKQKEVLVDDIMVAGFREEKGKYIILLYLPYLKKEYCEMIFDMEDGMLLRLSMYNAYICQSYKRKQKDNT